MLLMQYVPTTNWHQQSFKDDILTTILDITGNGNGNGNGKGNSQQNDIISMSKENDYTYYHH